MLFSGRTQGMKVKIGLLGRIIIAIALGVQLVRLFQNGSYEFSLHLMVYLVAS